MLVKLASAPSRDDRPNEDFAAASAKAVVLVDGAGVPPGLPAGCRHGVDWYARTLATALLSAIGRTGNGSLADGLRATLAGLRDLHAGTCELDRAGSPSATVVAVRERAEWIEYLVLGGTFLVAESGSGAPTVITDVREELAGRDLRGPLDDLPPGTPEHRAALRGYAAAMRRRRNVPGGFWAAGADPAAADHAFTGVLPLKDLTGVALLSDGAGRLVDRFELMGWPELLATLRTSGPDELIAQTRKAEAGDEDGHRWPRDQAYDDATAIYVRF